MASRIAKCRGVDCPVRDQCRRYTEPQRSNSVLWVVPKDVGETCSHFLPNIKWAKSNA